MEKQKNAVGRRKEAVTRVFLSKGEGKITVNDKDYKDYFNLPYLQNQVELPLKTIESSDKFDVKVNAAGGGIKGQAEAIKLYRLAAAQGNAQAAKNRDLVAAKMTPDQIAQAQALAAAWKPTTRQ